MLARFLAIALVAGCGGPSTRPVERLESFNDRVVALTSTYPVHGFGGYAWPSRDGASGTTRDLRLADDVIARGGDGNHCVGMTFEVYWRALEACDGGAAAVFDTTTARDFRARWYVPEAGAAGAADALVSYHLGTAVPLADARPGDFVQAWTADASIGHSFVFLGLDRDAAGEPSVLHYWSSQPWTEGIGVSEMAIGETGWDRDRIHVARAACR